MATRLDGLVLSVSTVNGITSSQVQNAGTVLSRTTSTYNDLWQVTSSTDAAGQTTRYQYDLDGRQTAVSDALTETSLTVYDAAGREANTTDALGHTTQYVYNADGQKTQTIFADGSTTQTAYDDLGRVSAATDQMGRVTQYQHDSQGRLTAVALPAVLDPPSGKVVNPTTNYTYDIYGDLTQIQDTAGRLTKFTFDQYGHQLTRTLPIGQTESSTYDSFRRISTQVDFAGQKTQYHYDSLGRLDTKTFYSAGQTTPGETVVYAFDNLGRQYQVTDTIGSNVRVTQYGFDAENRISSITTPEGTVNYVFDLTTGYHTRTVTANSDNTYGYDQVGRLKTVTVTKQNGLTLTTALVTTYYYTPVGTIDHITYPNGTETDDGYDSLNRAIVVTNKKGSMLLSSYAYTLEADGLRTGVTEQQLEADSTYSTLTKIWSYDALLRLTQEAYTTTLSPTTNNYIDQYVYDVAGNRLSKTHTAGGQTLVSTYLHDANNELTNESGTLNGASNYATTYGYDRNGSLISVSRTGNGAETDSYGYDLQNRLKSANINRTENGQAVAIQAAYSFDDGGWRAQAVVTTTVGGGTPGTTTRQYVVDVSNPSGYSQVLEQHNNGAATPSMSYVVGQTVLAQTDSTGTTSMLLPDGQGSTRLVTNTAGAITVRYAYDAYGNLLGVQANVVNRPVTQVLYVGQLFDPQLQNYYLRARYYGPSTGRFAARDPLREASNDANAYRYARANPIMFVDPTGMDSEIELEEAITDGEAVDLALEEPIMIIEEQVIHSIFAIRVISTLLLSGIATSAVTIIVLNVLQEPWPIDSPVDVTTDIGQDDCNCTPSYQYSPFDIKQRATGAYARFSKDQIRPAGERADFDGYPSWWNPVNLPIQNGQILNSVWDRGHLIGSKLGGAGGTQYKNLVPLYRRANYPTMYTAVEKSVADRALAGACIDYYAAPIYETDQYYPDFVAIIALANSTVSRT